MFYLLKKNKNISSFKTIRNFALTNNIKKIGHTGTLDPFAKGLLLVATDEDTKLISYIENKDKTYIAEVKFGYQTDTYDVEGKIINTSNILIKEENLTQIITWLKDQVDQIPPIYSAKKINGYKAYELARQNKTFSLKKQSIKIYDAKILSFDFINQLLKIEITVSNGTYIRSLFNDCAIFFNTFAYLENLERITISKLNISLLKNNDFVKINDGLLFTKSKIYLSKENISKLKNGLELINEQKLENNEYLLVDISNKNEILGIIEVDNNKIRSKKLFGNKLNSY
ncbi:tRNA pseudouridine(55) synthase TruB [Mycoplasmopsis meleagridis]|uniref:tRNA pseudouridine(55) synthase TruB n=1 Tax=Mycoplasmopsis meleagridis TaxID=29561 RepID=UPI003A85DA73